LKLAPEKIDLARCAASGGAKLRRSTMPRCSASANAAASVERIVAGGETV
jgi:hypothetical protein